jgi:hypothetical protein
MPWIRSNTRFASWLALFALAVQFTLSFGHLHFNAPVSKATPTIATGFGIDSPAPKDNRPDKHGEYCAICAVIHMASSSLTATPASLQLPDLLPHDRMMVTFDARAVAVLRLPTQPRAPPVS